MGGWGQNLMLVNPSGRVLPCHAAEVLPGMSFENVREKPLQWIWEESKSFQRFRGESWMPEPCRSCDHRAKDFGGCRCQAFLLTGDAAATDPACSLAPKHSVVESALQESPMAVPVKQRANSFVQLQQQNAALWTYRTNAE
jgi:PqqA peptide cyclase